MKITFEEFVARNAGARHFLRERSGGSVMLAVSPQRLVMNLVGSLPTEHVVGVLRDAREAGLLQSDDFSALADMLDFTGVIDWKVIPQISEVMPKGDHHNKNAYLVRNSIFALLAKINTVLFPKTQHATFQREAEARKWLGWE